MKKILSKSLILTLVLFLFIMGNQSHSSERKLFSSDDLRELEKIKTKDFISNNFKKDLQLQTRKKLGLLLANATKAHKDYLKKEVISNPWKRLDKKDHDRMLNKLIEKELQKYHNSEKLKRNKH